MNSLTVLAAPNVIPLPPPKKRSRFTGRWLPTRYANLVRSKATGAYAVRAKVHGRQVYKRLETSSLEIAKRQADEFLRGERERLAKRPDESLTVADLSALVLADIDADPTKKPSAKLYRLQCWEAIVKHAPEFTALPAVDVTDLAVSEVCAKLRKHYSGTRFNGQLTQLRAILRLARLRGLLSGDPAEGVKRASIPLTPPELPEDGGFDRLLAFLDADPKRRLSARLVRFLAYSGARIGQATAVRPEDIDFTSNTITLPKIKFDEVPTVLPMIPEMQALCRQLLADYPGDGPLLPIKSPRTALRTCCKAAGIARLTPHKFRHLFATRCLEVPEINVKTLATWLGHKDGGALLLKRYAHTRDKHSQAMAAKVSFAPVTLKENAPSYEI